MQTDVIFIHIPKTGGTTINAAMQQSYWQTKPNFNYRHILSDKKSNAGDIFSKKKLEEYQKFKIFMMLRHPIDRIVSEYYFIKDREEFMRLLKNKPNNLQEYIENAQTQNAVVNFLMGRRMYDVRKATEGDLNQIINTINAVPINVGIFEEFELSLSYFSEKTNLEWKNRIEAKRITFKRPSLSEVDDRLKETIIKNNPLDFSLYEFCKEKFKSETNGLKPKKIKFIKDKYNHVIPYCLKWCFFEFCVENKSFLKLNFEYFKALTFYLINELGIKDGKEYTKVWIETFLNTIKVQPEFYHFVIKGYKEDNDPLENLYFVGNRIDLYYQNKNLKIEKLLFDKSQVMKPKKKFLGLF